MIEQFTLPNGLRVLCEQLPHLRSVSMGVWVKAGSILEREHENGLSHLIEHMAFKGTGRRSAKQIAQEMDASTLRRYALNKGTIILMNTAALSPMPGVFINSCGVACSTRWREPKRSSSA